MNDKTPLGSPSGVLGWRLGHCYLAFLRALSSLLTVGQAFTALIMGSDKAVVMTIAMPSDVNAVFIKCPPTIDELYQINWFSPACPPKVHIIPLN